MMDPYLLIYLEKMLLSSCHPLAFSTPLPPLNGNSPPGALIPVMVEERLHTQVLCGEAEE